MIDNKFSRTALLIGEDNLKKLTDSHIAVFGVGGVGSFVVEALVRSGVGEITIVDGDIVDVSNINRQLVATVSTIGKPKVEVAERHILDVNPDVKTHSVYGFFNKETLGQYNFSDYDYVVDAIDNITSKLLLISECNKVETPIICCMGAGNKLNPTAFEIADIYSTSVCPLARVIRKEVRALGIKQLKVLYSKEQPKDSGVLVGNKQVTGSIAYVPSVAGLIIAAEVVKDIGSNICKQKN